jgi:hypothetical protein
MAAAAPVLRLRPPQEPEGGHVFWIVSILVGGVGIAWWAVRHRRKAAGKAA